MNKAPINVQDSFFYNLRKDNIAITVRLTSINVASILDHFAGSREDLYSRIRRAPRIDWYCGR